MLRLKLRIRDLGPLAPIRQFDLFSLHKRKPQMRWVHRRELSTVMFEIKKETSRFSVN